MSQLNPKDYPQRTARQNRALHVMCNMMAETLNEHGLDMRKTLKEEISIDWTGKSFKEYMLKPIIKAQFNKASTKDLNTVEVDAGFDTINKHLGEKFGLHVPFPSIESVYEEQERERQTLKAAREARKKKIAELKQELEYEQSMYNDGLEAPTHTAQFRAGQAKAAERIQALRKKIDDLEAIK